MIFLFQTICSFSHIYTKKKKKRKITTTSTNRYSTVLWIMCAVFSAHWRDKSSTVYFHVKIKRPTNGPITRRLQHWTFLPLHHCRHKSITFGTKIHACNSFFSFLFFFLFSQNGRCFDLQRLQIVICYSLIHITHDDINFSVHIMCFSASIVI